MLTQMLTVQRKVCVCACACGEKREGLFLFNASASFSDSLSSRVYSASSLRSFLLSALFPRSVSLVSLFFLPLIFSVFPMSDIHAHLPHHFSRTGSHTSLVSVVRSLANLLDSGSRSSIIAPVFCLCSAVVLTASGSGTQTEVGVSESVVAKSEATFLWYLPLSLSLLLSPCSPPASFHIAPSVS